VLILNLLVFTASFVTYILSKDNRILFVVEVVRIELTLTITSDF